MKVKGVFFCVNQLTSTNFSSVLIKSGTLGETSKLIEIAPLG